MITICYTANTSIHSARPAPVISPKIEPTKIAAALCKLRANFAFRLLSMSRPPLSKCTTIIPSSEQIATPGNKKEKVL